ncbi:sphingomyelin phosphodiesterase [Ciona intestinalis]
MMQQLVVLVVAYITIVNCLPLLQNNRLHFTPSSGGESTNHINEINDALNKAPLFTKQFNKASPLSTLECTACNVALDAALWKYRTPNGTYPGLPGFIITLCKYLKIETNSVCEGMIHELQNETLFLLNKLQLTGSQLCGLIFPTSCPAKDLSWNNNKWVVPIPKPHKVKNRVLPKNSKELKVLQISDIHIDLLYKPGSAANCKEPLCCRDNTREVGQDKVTAGYWGTAAACDTPYWTLENLFQRASEDKFDYIIWTGDLPAHNDWSQTREGQIKLLSNLTNLLTHYFPNTPVYPSLGNHESNPVNSFPPNYVKGANNISWLYDALAKAWSPWLPQDAITTVRESGFYTTIVKPGLRLVSMNMNYCNTENFWMLLDPVDPNGELAWLVKTLEDAEDNGEVVHIIGHIPPSMTGDCLKVWRNNYHDIISRYRDIIMAQFFGHTHKDEIEIQYNDSSLAHPVSMAYIAPSVTTYTKLFPSYRTYSMDGNSWKVLDHSTYTLNLTEANTQGASPIWKLEYSARAEYNLTSLDLNSWHELYRSWINNSDQSKSFQKYYTNFYKGNPPNKECDRDCKIRFLCGIQTGNYTSPC